MLNEEIKKINGQPVSKNNCKTTKHYKLTCNKTNVALNYFNKNGGPECPNNPTKTSINKCNFSVKKDV